MVHDSISYRSGRGCGLPSSLQVLIALRFYASGTFQDMIGELIGVSQVTVCRTLKRVTNALYEHIDQHIKLPTQAEANIQKEKFFEMRGMPNIFGCIDGTHIRIQAPTPNDQAVQFINRKNYHSINVQVCNMPGSVHDARILRESALFEAFERPQKPIDGIILGDSGYMIREWLLTPFPHVQTAPQEQYNYAHSATRTTIERCIGVLKRRFHCLHTELRLAPRRVCKIVSVCMMLHNFAIRHGNVYDGADDIPPQLPPQPPGVADNPTERARTAAGKAVRDRIVREYFRVWKLAGKSSTTFSATMADELANGSVMQETISLTQQIYE
ncbi:hypothetical protein EGW08_008231 [Elysia chlorotica]|uniref:DDE Tnp4 domain-containing protein n=1 Tax=Elysia chlorotica TaxID=188477 RepID=A0A433TQX3_ELYCH|nr:hypothetical protein EGW08_008231 [Elysia chlorotica]